MSTGSMSALTGPAKPTKPACSIRRGELSANEGLRTLGMPSRRLRVAQ